MDTCNVLEGAFQTPGGEKISTDLSNTGPCILYYKFYRQDVATDAIMAWL